MSAVRAVDGPPHFAVVPGGRDSPVILHVPHSSTRIPPQARASIVLDDAGLAEELRRMTDAHTELLARRAAAASGAAPWLFVNGLSRLVIDPERFPNEREEMLEVGMGAVYTATSQRALLREPDDDRDRALIADYFDPYAAALTDVVDERLRAAGHVVIIDVHSYPRLPLPYERHAGDRRPQICVGVDADHTPRWLQNAALRACRDLGEVVVNEPFQGTYVPLKHYGLDTRVSSLMVEIRRDLYLHEPGGEVHAGADAVVSALSALISAASSADPGGLDGG